MEFWNPIIVDKSWELLKFLRKNFNFILIGGWATYILTKTLKSKDIDMLVDFDELSKLKTKLNIKKNDRLNKYEAKVGGVDVDIYVDGYSKFAIPTSEIVKNTILIDNFKVPKPEILLILKQEAELARGDSIKGKKDRADLISLLMFSDFDFKTYLTLVKKYGLEEYADNLKRIILTSDNEFKEFGKTPREIKLIKKEYIKKLQSLP